MGGHGVTPSSSPEPPEEVGGKYSREIYLKAKELYSKGYSIKEISEMLDIPIWTLKDWLLYGAGYKKYLGQERRYSLKEYYKVRELYRKGYKVAEICRVTGIPRHTVREWVKRGKRPKDNETIMVKYFSEIVTKMKKYKRDYLELLNDPEKLPYLLYLYGAVITDGCIYFHNGRFKYIEITGEKIFLERVNNVVFKIIGRTYGIFRAYNADCHRIRIYDKSLGLALHQLKNNFKFIIRVSKDNMLNARAFLLGLIDGDGSFTNKGKRCYIIFRKTKHWFLVSYSAYLLRRLGIKPRFAVKKGGRIHVIRGVMVKDRDRFMWVCRAEPFLSRVGPTIKVLKRDDIPEHIRNILERADNPIK